MNVLKSIAKLIVRQGFPVRKAVPAYLSVYGFLRCFASACHPFALVKRQKKSPLRGAFRIDYARAP
jgi:hypothetical protein